MISRRASATMWSASLSSSACLSIATAFYYRWGKRPSGAQTRRRQSTL
jgi:hypothetical protein